MTSRQLTSVGRRIMKRLDMPEWIQRAKFTLVRDLRSEAGEPLHGRSTWMPEEASSEIEVNHTEDLQLMMETLIHELLHLQYEGHKPPQDVYDESYERGLNRTAAALYQAWKPQGRKSKKSS